MPNVSELFHIFGERYVFADKRYRHAYRIDIQAEVSSSRLPRRPSRRYKKSPRHTLRGAGRETRRRIYIRLTRTRKNEAPDKANKKERSKKNANGKADDDDENESDDGKHSPRKSSDDADYLTEYEHRVFTLGESEERDDEENNISNLRNSREYGNIHGDLPLVRLFPYLYSTVAAVYNGNTIGNGIGNIACRILSYFILFIIILLIYIIIILI